MLCSRALLLCCLPAVTAMMLPVPSTSRDSPRALRASVDTAREASSTAPFVGPPGAGRGFGTPFETWSASGVTFQREYENAAGVRIPSKVVKYDSRELLKGGGWAKVLFTPAVAATIFGDAGLYVSVASYAAVALAVQPVCAALGLAVPSADDVESLRGLVDFLSASLTFVLGLFISQIVDRWWRARTEALGALWGAVDTLAMLGAVWWASDREGAAACAVVRRYGVLAHALLFKQCRGEADDLSDLTRAGLLEAHEADALRAAPVKAMVVWVWMGRFWQAQIDAGRVPVPESNARLIFDKIALGRDAVGAAWTYTDCQLPFAYVHVLAAVSRMAIISNSLATGAALPPASDGGIALLSDPIALAASVARLALYPLFFEGLLNIAGSLENPFGVMHSPGDSEEDFLWQERGTFPALAYSSWIASECAAFETAAARTSEPGWWAGTGLDKTQGV